MGGCEVAMTTTEVEAVLAKVTTRPLTARQRRQMARTLRSVTDALPPGTGPMSALHGDLVTAADVLDRG
jgi:hypothetical protein